MSNQERKLEMLGAIALTLLLGKCVVQFLDHFTCLLLSQPTATCSGECSKTLLVLSLPEPAHPHSCAPCGGCRGEQGWWQRGEGKYAKGTPKGGKLEPQAGYGAGTSLKVKHCRQ